MNWKRFLAIALPAALAPTAIGVLVATTRSSVRADEMGRPAPVSVAWEVLESGPLGSNMARTRTPGGWLVRVSRGSGSECLTYIPDPEHLWGQSATEGGK